MPCPRAVVLALAPVLVREKVRGRVVKQDAIPPSATLKSVVKAAAQEQETGKEKAREANEPNNPLSISAEKITAAVSLEWGVQRLYVVWNFGVAQSGIRYLTSFLPA